MSIPEPGRPKPLIDLERDELRPISEICYRLTGKRPAPQTIWRWRHEGCRGVKLEAVKFSGAWRTSAKAFAAFIAGQTQAANDACTAETGATERDAGSTERDSATERRLRAAGLLDRKRTSRIQPDAVEGPSGVSANN